MKCLYCKSSSTKVIATTKTGHRVLRERKCTSCNRHFWTNETCSMENQYFLKKDLALARELSRKAQRREKSEKEALQTNGENIVQNE